MEDPSILDIFLVTLRGDLMRYVVGAGGVWLVINVTLKTALARRKIRPEAPGSQQIWREILASLRTVLIFAAIGTLIAMAAMSGNLRMYFQIEDYGWVWLVVSTLLIIVTHDAYFYWMHRALHDRFLWRWMHSLHHRSKNPTPFTSYSFDIGEALANAAFLPLYLALVPMHPVALFVFTVHMMLRNAIGHCGVEIFPARRDGRPLFGWLTTVTHHDLHHAGGPWNFGLYFSWWDRMMGTEHPRYLEEFARVAQPAPRASRALLPVLLGALVLPQPADARDLTGTYATPGLQYLVRFAPCRDAPDRTCGILVWALHPRSARHVAIGAEMLRGLVWQKDAWRGGTLTDPNDGSEYTGKIRPGNGAVTLSGCAAIVLCQTQIWYDWKVLWKRLPRPQ